MVILLLENDKRTADSITRLLGREKLLEPLEVLSAACFVEAIAILEAHKNRLDLVIADITNPGDPFSPIPDQGGADLIRLLNLQDAKIPVVAMSGNPFAWHKLVVSDQEIFGPIHFYEKPSGVIHLLSDVRGYVPNRAITSSNAWQPPIAGGP
jgi:CheY-like chemotaxis protein